LDVKKRYLYTDTITTPRLCWDERTAVWPCCRRIDAINLTSNGLYLVTACLTELRLSIQLETILPQRETGAQKPR